MSGSLCLLLVFLAALPCIAKDAVIDGYVREKDGSPVKGAQVLLEAADYPEQDVLVVPIITDKAVGGVVATLPSSHTHIVNGHSSTTDKHGHYRIKVPPGHYHVVAPLHSWQDFKHSLKLGWIDVGDGKTIMLNFDLLGHGERPDTATSSGSKDFTPK